MWRTHRWLAAFTMVLFFGGLGGLSVVAAAVRRATPLEPRPRLPQRTLRPPISNLQNSGGNYGLEITLAAVNGCALCAPFG